MGDSKPVFLEKSTIETDDVGGVALMCGRGYEVGRERRWGGGREGGGVMVREGSCRYSDRKGKRGDKETPRGGGQTL